jgi:hypothetical protein
MMMMIDETIEDIHDKQKRTRENAVEWGSQKKKNA